MLNQTYILYFYIRTGNLAINLVLFQEVSLQWFFPSFPDFPAFQNIYDRRTLKKKKEAFGEKETLRLYHHFKN